MISIPKSFRFLSIISLLIFTSVGNAEITLPREQIEQSFSFPEGYSAEIKGFRIGMTIQEVIDNARQKEGIIEEKIIEEQKFHGDNDGLFLGTMRSGYIIKDYKIGLSLDYSNGITIKVEPFIQAMGLNYGVDFFRQTGEILRLTSPWLLKQGRFDEEKVEITFGSPLSGGRVQAIQYQINYAEPLDIKLVRKSIEEKYGDFPSVKAAPGTWTFGWGASYFFSEGKLSLYKNDMDYPVNSAVASRCMLIQERFIVPNELFAQVSYYHTEDERGIQKYDASVCDGVVQVGLQMTTPTSVVGLSVVIEDKGDIRIDTERIDNFLANQVDQILAAPGGKEEAPDL